MPAPLDAEWTNYRVRSAFLLSPFVSLMAPPIKGEMHARARNVPGPDLHDHIASLLLVDLLAIFDSAAENMGATGNTVHRKIEELRGGHLSGLEADEMHTLRKLRNEVGHDMQRCASRELEAGAVFVQALLERWGQITKRAVKYQAFRDSTPFSEVDGEMLCRPTMFTRTFWLGVRAVEGASVEVPFEIEFADAVDDPRAPTHSCSSAKRGGPSIRGSSPSAGPIETELDEVQRVQEHMGVGADFQAEMEGLKEEIIVSMDYPPTPKR